MDALKTRSNEEIDIEFENSRMEQLDPDTGGYDPEAAIRDLFDEFIVNGTLPDPEWNATDRDFDDDEILASAQGVAMENIVNRPAHYTQYEIEPITFIMKNGFDFWRGNIIKYASRAGSKIYDGMDAVESEITDLEKVRRYAEMRINQLKGEKEL